VGVKFVLALVLVVLAVLVERENAKVLGMRC
jgi:hypothetical protein